MLQIVNRVFGCWEILATVMDGDSVDDVLLQGTMTVFPSPRVARDNAEALWIVQCRDIGSVGNPSFCASRGHEDKQKHERWSLRSHLRQLTSGNSSTSST